MKGYITKQGLKQLDNYKYKPYGSTWIDSKMNYFWQWLVQFMPKWMAPNMITFIGWLCLIFSYVNMLRYDYTFSKNIPSSCFYIVAACVFIYLNLDAIDGKQARRTNTSSPLGQLFDHGCDSFSQTFLILGICEATQLDSTEVFLLFIAGQISFFVANWGQYHTGYLRTKVGQLGVTEAQLLIILMHFITGLYGQSIWSFKLKSIIPYIVQKKMYPLLWKLCSLKVSSILVYCFSYLIIILNVYVILKTIIKSQNKKQTMLQFVSLGILILMEFLWSRMKIYEQYSALILVNFGIITSLIVCKMIICSVTKMKLQAFHWQLLPLMISSLFLFALRYLKAKKYYLVCVFNGCVFANIIISLIFLYLTITQITEYLGIYCFSVHKRQRKMHIQ